MSDFLLSADPLTGDPAESYGPPPEPMVRVPMIGRDKRILREVAQAHRVSLDDIIGPRRHKVFVAARREAMQRIRSELGFSYPHIGRLFNCNHATVLYACRGGRPTNPPSEKGVAMTDIVGAELKKKLIAQVADYQHHFGRPKTIELLTHLLRTREEAQRLMDSAIASQGEPKARAAE